MVASVRVICHTFTNICNSQWFVSLIDPMSSQPFKYIMIKLLIIAFSATQGIGQLMGYKYGMV